MAIQVSTESLDELIEEVRASLAFYGEQPSARHVRRILVTGGGSQLSALPSALSGALGIDVERADPFARVRLGRTGFEPGDLPYLAPYMAAAVGVALGQTRPKDRRIDLRPVSKRATHQLDARQLLIGAGVVIVIGGVGALYMNGRGQVADARTQVSAASAQLADLQTQIDAQPAVHGQISSKDAASPAIVAASVAATDVDWVSVEQAVEELSAPLGVTISSFRGVFDQPNALVTVTGPQRPGRVTLTATAPSLPAVADWLDSLAADPRFADPWAGGLTMIGTAGRVDRGAVDDGDVRDRREPRRAHPDNGGSDMNRSRKDISMMAMVAVLLIFATYNFLFRPQRSDLSDTRSQLGRVQQNISEAQLALQKPLDTSVSGTDPAASAPAIPLDPAMAQLFRQLQAVADQTGVTLGADHSGTRWARTRAARAVRCRSRSPLRDRTVGASVSEGTS